MSGFVTIHRQALDNPVLDSAARLGAWTWLIMRAAWKPTKFRIGSKIVTLDRGQLCVSLRQLADEWHWSKSTVDRFLSALEAETMVGREAGHGRLILTICNYATYQDLSSDARDSRGTDVGHLRDNKEQINKGTRDTPDGVSRAKRATRLPENWEPILTAASQRIVDGWPPGKLDRELAAFRDHARDKGRTSKDWQAAFRTWIGKADEWFKRDGNKHRGNAIADALDRRIRPVESTGEANERNDRLGAGDSGGPVARIASMR